MRIWTIDAELGCGGRAIARRVAEQADVRVVDCWAAVAVGLGYGATVRDAHVLEETACSRAIRWGLAVGLTTRSAPELVHELTLRDRCREELERVVHEAARERCVILGYGASAALAGHPGALHARIHAPRAWRIRRLASQQLWPLARAASEIERADRRRRNAERRIFGAAIEGPHAFHVACDASRLSQDAIVGVLSGANVVAQAEPADADIAAAR